jgi:hypothetical protein
VWRNSDSLPCACACDCITSARPFIRPTVARRSCRDPTSRSFGPLVMSLAQCTRRRPTMQTLLAQRLMGVRYAAPSARCITACVRSSSSWLHPPSPIVAFTPLSYSLHSLRSFHSAASVSGSFLSAPSLAVAPTAPSFDAPLPTLESVAIDPSELVVDDSALKRLRALAAKHGRPVNLRVLVDQGGCSGLEYKFNVEVDTPPQEDDMSVAAHASAQENRIVCAAWFSPA